MVFGYNGYIGLQNHRSPVDERTHYLHGPGNNAVANDTVVGPPQHIQWLSGPCYARSHEISSSMGGMVTAGGRLFTLWDEGPTGLTDPQFPAQWSLIARDAFNGTVLWKRPMPDWGWRQWHDASRWDDPRGIRLARAASCSAQLDVT